MKQWQRVLLFVVILLIFIRIVAHVTVLGHRRPQMFKELTQQECPPPVLLIPGLGGSRLYASKKGEKRWKRCWVTWAGMFPEIGKRANKWRQDMSITYNSDTSRFEDADNVDITAWRKPNYDRSGRFRLTPDFGGVEGCSNLMKARIHLTWQFQGVINWMRKELHYRSMEDGGPNLTSLFGSTYDFRRITDPEYWQSFCAQMKDLIEYIVHLRKQPVRIVSHSLGSVALLAFLTRYLPSILVPNAVAAWKQRYIHEWMSINGSFGGSSKALRSAVSGDSHGMAILCKKSCNSWYQPLSKQMSAVLWMLPHPLIFQGPPVISISNQRTYCASKSDISTLFKHLGNKGAIDAYEDTLPPLLTLDPPDVKVLAVVCTTPSDSESVSTPLQLMYRVSNKYDEYAESPFSAIHNVHEKCERQFYEQLWGSNYSPTSIQNCLRGDCDIKDMRGDGTVPYISLMVPRLWMPGAVSPNRQTVRIARFNTEKLGHTSVLFDEAFMRQVKPFFM